MNIAEATAAVNAAFNNNRVRAGFSLVPIGDDKFDVIIHYGLPDVERGAMLAKQILGPQFNEWRLSRPT